MHFFFFCLVFVTTLVDELDLLRRGGGGGVVVGGCGCRGLRMSVTRASLVAIHLSMPVLFAAEASGKCGHVSASRGHVGLAKLKSGSLTNVGECFLVLVRIPQHYDSVGWIMDEGSIVKSIAFEVSHSVTQAFPPIAQIGMALGELDTDLGKRTVIVKGKARR